MSEKKTQIVVVDPAVKQPKGNVFGRHFRSAIITGLITLFPLYITLTVLIFIFTQATTFSKDAAKSLVPPMIRLVASPPAEPGKVEPAKSDPGYEAWVQTKVAYEEYYAAVATIQSWTWPLLAIIISVMVVYILGVLGNFVLGRRLLAAVEHFVENLPLVKGIYGTVKQVIGVFRQGSSSAGFQRVVMVEFPRQGTWCIAFVTNTITDTSTKKTMVCVFIPMTPNPTSGYFQIFPEEDVRETEWTVDQGIKILLSGGLLAPSEMSLAGAKEGVKATVGDVVSPPTTSPLP